MRVTLAASGAGVLGTGHRWTVTDAVAVVFVLVAPWALSWPIGPLTVPLSTSFYMRPALYVSDIALGAILLARLARGSRRSGPHRPAITFAFAALVGLAVATVPTAAMPSVAAYHALRWGLAFALYLALVMAEVSGDRVATALLLGLAVQVVVGVAQVWKQGPLGLPGEMALPAGEPGAAYIPMLGLRWLRAYGLTSHPNVFGGFLAVAMILALPRVQRWRWRTVWWLLWVGLVLTFSRSAWLALAAGLTLYVVWQITHRRARLRELATTLIPPVLVTVALVAAMPWSVEGRLLLSDYPAERRSVTERSGLASMALQSIARHPVTGVGAGNSPLVPYLQGSAVPPQPVHDVTLLLAEEVGVAGGVCWLVLWLAPGVALLRRRRTLDPMTVSVIAAWLALGVAGLFDHYPWALNSGRSLSVVLLALVSHSLSVPEVQA
ncbi:MAG: O-antigen ligase family protein [Anaerolineae bacterium]